MTSYSLPTNYQARLTPQYFNDTLQDAHLWQADVYYLAVHLARHTGVERLVDIGCGRGGKLLPHASEFKIAGYDYGDNIDYCRQIAPAGNWYSINLNDEVLAPELFKDSVVICADVIEHLVSPDAFISTLKNAVKTAAYVLVSTPDRERLQQGTENGPPANSAHVREWTEQEFRTWLQAERLPVVWSGWTISHEREPSKVNTILTILASEHTIDDLPLVFEKAYS